MENNITSIENSALCKEKTGLPIWIKVLATASLVSSFAFTIILWESKIPDVDWYVFEKPEEVWTTQIKWNEYYSFNKNWENFVEINNYSLDEKDLEKVKNLALASRLSKKLENWETYIVKELLIRNIGWEIFVWYIWVDWKNYNSTLYDLTIKAKEALDQIDKELEQNKDRWCEWVIKLWWDLCIEWQDKRDIDEYILSKKESWETGYQVDIKDDLKRTEEELARTEKEWLDAYWGKDWNDFNYGKFNVFVEQTLEATTCTDTVKAKKVGEEKSWRRNKLMGRKTRLCLKKGRIRHNNYESN